MSIDLSPQSVLALVLRGEWPRTRKIALSEGVTFALGRLSQPLKTGVFRR